jgi:hypothetical protein
MSNEVDWSMVVRAPPTGETATGAAQVPAVSRTRVKMVPSLSPLKAPRSQATTTRPCESKARLGCHARWLPL